MTLDHMSTCFIFKGEERSYCIPKEVDGCTNHCPPSCKSNEKLCRPARDSSNPECPGIPQCVAQAEDTECPVFCPKVCPGGYYNCIQNLPIMIAGTEHTCPVGTSNCIKYDSASCSEYCPDPTQCAVDEIQCDTRPRPLDGSACINEPGVSHDIYKFRFHNFNMIRISGNGVRAS